MVNDQASTDSCSYVGCFFHPINCSKDSSQSITLNFENSLAKKGGSDIYGGSLLECSDSTFLCDLAVNNDTSVSSDPLRICICDHNSFGRQQCQCDEFESNVHPGESFNLSSVLVGYDYGPTTGVVYADVLPNGQSYSNLQTLDSNSKNGHVISNNKQCTNLSFSLSVSGNFNDTPENVIMYITAVHMDTQTVHKYLV